MNGDDEAGLGTTNLGWGRSVLGGSMLGCDDLVGGAIGAMRVWDGAIDLAGGAIGPMRVWDGAIEWVFWVWRMGLGIARRTSLILGFLGSSESVSGFSLFFLYLSLSLSLSLCAWAWLCFPEIILHPNTWSIEKHFRKIYFPCATKHPHLQKSISGSDFHLKQTQP